MAWHGGAEWLLEIALIILLGLTLFHALRLERALGVLKRDRAALEELVAGFNASTRQAESGIERLREAADSTGRQIARQIDSAIPLKDDLLFLMERGERLADRMEALVRTGRELAQDPIRHPLAEARRLGGFLEDPVRLDSPPAERRPARVTPAEAARLDATEQGQPTQAPADPTQAGQPRLRSQAERDLLKALRIAR